ncbi:CTTNBP2 N-terminal-like protein [Metopolophium dirhodum]|uniref:CTTNBP2 N-terminal-like protein n=1 Tax=Metopolophium dirhodum TaxID=44670 RepID=UPI00298FA028|nr:CTTNBP2 N-terminal-like protein [Metopolophium dirhodum]XP_060857722.1 CTTNBP2 N-terminal-like protein [Metopolophium dirhodum]XP_060857723.1 CTTNBP2 N-terminal-like protein [Metopolophium dirhodum]
MTTKNENSINCNSSQNEAKGRQNSDRNTVKKIPKMDLNKSDLLKLLSYLEGELQARDIVIATLKCEKVKCMLRNRGSDRVVKDPLAALQRDCFATFETNNDSLSYQQLGSLENLVLQQRRTHLRIANVLKDNQVMHRKILDLERLKKQQLQYEYKKLHNTFEEERLKHKQIVFFLLAERKKIVMKYIEERKRSEDLGQILSEEKGKIDSMAEGLEEESKKSLQMEAELEKQLALFDTESKKMMAALSLEEKKTNTLEAELTKCRSEIISLEKELSEALHNNLMELSSRSSVSGVRIMSSPSDPIMSSVAKVVQPTATASSVRVSGPMTGIARSVNPGQSLRCLKPISGKTNDSQVDKPQDDEDCSTPLDTIKKHPISFGRSMQSDSGSTSTVKKSLFGIQRNMSVPNATESNIPGLIKKQITTVGRGTPPPVPPNKPIIPPKKDLISFIKKTSIADNAASTADKDQKDSQLRHNSFLPNEIAPVDKPDEMVKN